MSEPGRYVLAKPVDEAEIGRLDLQHRLWLIQHHGLYSAPISKSSEKRVVDIGCGTGVWAIAFAKEHPDSHVLGVDISLPQPKSAPGNCSFAVADAEGDWSFATESFDLIHSRMLVNSIRNWPGYLKRCLQHLKPGGWLEINDVAHRFFAEDGCSEAESPMLRWWRVVFQESSRKNGINIDDTYKHAQQMRDAGFVDVRERVFKWPVGVARASTHEEKAIGNLQYQNVQVLIGGVTNTAVQHDDLSNMTAQQAQTLAEEAQLDVTENSVRHGYYMHFATYVGQAPLYSG
ncbi:hypothetical protein ACLMJK_006257 [Lecanora helva]